MANLFQQGDQFVKSSATANPNGKRGPARYGENGAQNASSDLPGKPKTTSGFLPPAAPSTENRQTRTVSAEQYPAAHGQKGAAAGPKVPPNNRPVKR